MLGRCTGAVLLGVEARLVEVEVDLGRGLPTISAVGLPDSAVREGIDRIRSALGHARFKLPTRRVTINLAPAEVRKHGSSLDLPIALALLLADAQVPRFDVGEAVVAGELALDGTTRPIRGALCLAIAARDAGFRRLVIPRANADEAALVDDLHVVAIETLADIAAIARGWPDRWPRPDLAATLRSATRGPQRWDLSEVRGQATARRALEVAAAGGHHLLLSGPPGTGKTMLARRLAGILPPLATDEAIEVTRVWSAAGLARGLVSRRPFRAPHHGISFGGMTGGGQRLRPGEISLASHGVLYLDELTEFRRDVLEALRQPLEEGSLTVVRLHGAATFPADFTLVASMNPCPCGYLGAGDGRCNCSEMQVRRYRAKLSGPLLDRFDLVVDVPRLDLRTLSTGDPGETSAAVAGRVLRTRERQRVRFGCNGPRSNSRMGPADLARWAALEPGGESLLLAAGKRLGLSGRGYDRVRRVARTLADMEGRAVIVAQDVAEALQYRHPDGSSLT